MLTKDQEKLITAYIEGNKITDIAKLLNVNRNTVYNWLDKDEVKAEMDRRKRDLANLGNQIILRGINTYISNIKALANDTSDKRVCLAANQYLLNRIYGNPTSIVETTEGESESVNEFELEAELKRFKLIKK